MYRIETTTLLFLASFAFTFAFTSHYMGVRSSRLAPNSSSKLFLAAIRVNGQNEKPGSELFPGKGPYIPSGLSEEQYLKIKKDEVQRMKRMDFGAWGPRFKRTETPNGDWMVMPSLWTNGFSARSRVEDTNRNKGSRLPGESLAPVTKATFQIRFYLPGLLLSYIVLDTFATALKMFQTAADLTVMKIIFLIFRVHSLSSSALNVSPLLKTQVTKWIAIAVLTPFMSTVLETMNRRRLWSKRRTLVACAAISSSSLAFLALILRLVNILRL